MTVVGYDVRVVVQVVMNAVRNTCSLEGVTHLWPLAILICFLRRRPQALSFQAVRQVFGPSLGRSAA